MTDKSRTQNSIRNISYGFIVTIVNVLVSFVNRTILVKVLGNEILGINGLFSEVIAVLSLAELGVGMAIIYSLYKPLSENNQKKINQLMRLYRVAYNAIAIVTMIIGLLITPFVHLLITDITYPLSYIRIVFVLFVLKTASSYLFSYKASLLNADQKQYITALVTAGTKLVSTVAIIVLLITTKNYIAYLCLLILQTVVTNFIVSQIVKKKYPYIDYKDKLEKSESREIFKNIGNIFVKKVSGVITNSTDSILISMLVSTVQVGIYSNYVMIFTVVRTLKQQFTNGLAASIGNLSVTESSTHCISVIKKLTTLYYGFALLMTSVIMGVSRDFITIWLGKGYILEDLTVFIAISVLFIEICCDPIWQYLEVSGLFSQDRNIAIIGSVTNLIVSVILGMKIGIAGILIGTICTKLIQLVLKTILIYKKGFKESPRSYFMQLLKIGLSYICLVLVEYYGVTMINICNIYLSLCVKGFVSAIVAIVICVTLYGRSEEFKYAIDLFKKLKTNAFAK